MILTDINEYLIDENKGLQDALKSLNTVEVKNLFVTRNDKLVGAITDGDIRRWMLSKGDLNAQIKEFANYHPKYLHYKDRLNAQDILKNSVLEAIPIVDDSKKIVQIIFEDGKAEFRGNLNIPVVIMAGGLGTRLYPYTKILPKPLIPIGEIPIAEHIINSFKKYGATEFHMILNHKKNMIKAYFNELETKDYKISFYDENVPLGTGGGLYLLKNSISSTFILSNCDILIDESYEKIYSYHQEQNNLITIVCSIKNYKIPYGVVEIGENGEFSHMKEKPNFSFMTNTGVYVVNKKIIDELEENTKIGFPDIIEKYKKQGAKVGIFPIGEESWMDMGEIDEMEKMIKKLGL